MTIIEATGVVPAPVEAAFGFLCALENHWSVAGRWIEVVSLTPGARGGRVRIHGPLGLRRTVTTRVESIDPPRCIRGTARVGRTCAQVSWTLWPHETGGAEVRLAAVVIDARAVDRALLAAGGARWMGWLFRATLRRLAATMAVPAAAPAVPALSSAHA